jgi:hypothetical protein
MHIAPLGEGAAPPDLRLTSPARTAEQALDLITGLTRMERLTPEMRAIVQDTFARYPDLWRTMGDLAVQARGRLMDGFTSVPVQQEAMQYGMAQIVEALGRHGAPMLEKLLIDQILVCWLAVYDAQIRLTQTQSRTGASIEAGEYWDKRVSRAQGRYLRACEMLARVRKLSAGAPVQVNIGGQQINVAGNLPGTK